MWMFLIAQGTGCFLVRYIKGSFLVRHSNVHTELTRALRKFCDIFTNICSIKKGNTMKPFRNVSMVTLGSGSG